MWSVKKNPRLTLSQYNNQLVDGFILKIRSTYAFFMHVYIFAVYVFVDSKPAKNFINCIRKK